MTDTRTKLLAAAQQELVEGHGHLEMQGVARRAQVSVGLAYHHFGSKAGLVAAVVENFYNELDAVAFGGARLVSPTWAGREKERIGLYLRFHYAHPFAPLVVGALSRAPEVLEVEAAFTSRQLADGARMLEAARRDGRVPADIDAHLTIALMIGGIRQALHGVLSGPTRPDPATLTDDIWRFIAAALRLEDDDEIQPPVPSP
ncbi:putative transcriptional regulator, TetR [Youhaiella tibetensis]|uniref:TetR/AcrR family transcriptional regulator n=1 Tax=Paradevosia tibetensis TaxID=1447062 RepID=A0A5B9DRG6_9HYPH|nr:TetR/AcrR family transcriptional regulator [Youhaiella tibetensis]QEE21817.1 TetR/AcrR family transcriptional regulator [Youhaiella tibetensis]GGF47997.1 putative transcriptional regulator, TetR [Youhaiella tibetensis]